MRHTRSPLPDLAPGYASTPGRLGVGAFARLIRDGALSEVGVGVAVPPSMAGSRTVRAACMAGLVPTGGTLTGLGALWVHGWRADEVARWPITVATTRGLHLSEPDATYVPWRCVTHNASVTHSLVFDGVRVSDAHAAIAMSLCHDPLELAIPAAWFALDTGLTRPEHVDAVMPRRGPHAPRGKSAWHALRRARAAYEAS